jgi:thiosulfate/3-mercaptopyruvate sulfurtransferase
VSSLSSTEAASAAAAAASYFRQCFPSHYDQSIAHCNLRSMALAALRRPQIFRPFMSATPGFAQPSIRTYHLTSYVVTPKELSDALKKNVHSKISTAPRIIPISAAWFMPNDPEKRTGIESFKQKRIPGARFFDLDDVKDHDSPYPHMLPTCAQFAESMSTMGLRKDDELVVFDTEELGLFSAPRVAWTMRVYGHPKVHVLNNFRLWVKEGYPTETGPPEVPNITKYPMPDYHTDMVVKFAEMKTIGYDHGKEGAEEIQILDARSKGRFDGTDPEPRPGLRSGHMPGSYSLPFQDLLDSDTKALLPPEKLKEIFESKGLDSKKPIIASCGTGVTAAMIEIALQEADFGPKDDRRLYDGSWT